jgi:hypothetical protein
MTDIYAMRVSGDTLSHLLLLTLKPGAVLLGRPQFFCGCADPRRSYLSLASVPIQKRLMSAYLFAVDDVNSDTDQYQADN